MECSDFSQEEEIEEDELILQTLLQEESNHNISSDSQGIYLIEDIYESLSQKNNILENLKISNKFIDLQKENYAKLNKLKLLLYQKFLRIIFSTIVVNLRGNLAIFFEKIKTYKFKILGFNFETTSKVKINLINRNINLLNFLSNL
jgi:hypothetical protein